MPAANPLRDAQSLGYRARGWTYERIANEMGYTNRSGAQKAVERAMAAAVRETTEAAKALLLADLNALKKEAWQVLESNHITVSHGQVVTITGPDGERVPVPDDSPVLNAIDRIVRIDQEMAKIYGAYAPTRSEVITLDAVEAEILKLEAEIGASGE
jgi:hypothetical protein